RHCNRNWRRANVAAAKLVEQMLKQNKRGLIIAAKNNSECKTTDGQSSFIMAICDDNIKKTQFGTYWMYAIMQPVVLLDKMDIDGNIYAVDCEIQCKGHVNVTTQLFVTKNATVDWQLMQSASSVPWNTKIHHDIPAILQDIEEKEEEFSRKRLFDDIILHLQKYMQLSIDNFGLKQPYATIAHNLMGIAYKNKAQYDTAIEFYEKGLQIVLDIFGANHAFAAQFYHNLGMVYRNKLQYDKSLMYYEKALQIKLEIFGMNHEDVSNSYDSLGHIYFHKGWYADAIACHKNSLKIKTILFGSMHRDVGDSYRNLGVVSDASQHKREAWKYYGKAWKIYTITLGEWDEGTIQVKVAVKKLTEKFKN
ncbi:hypothetical protein RFI_00331, partial [Reticulomyxa filosa]